jgi:hypothetical protein
LNVTKIVNGKIYERLLNCVAATHNSDILIDVGSKLRIQCGAGRSIEVDDSESLPEESGAKLNWIKNGKPFIAKGNNIRITKIG